ncbi:MAG: 4-hydroxybenzoate octaprenyltransferase [Gammaproteobacteria bacterium]
MRLLREQVAHPKLCSRGKQYIRLMRLDKPIGILLLLWPTLWALWIASQGRPHPWVLTVFLAGVVLMRSAGCVINDIADRKFDAHVARTRSRPLAGGTVAVREAVILFLLLVGTAFALVLSMNPLTIALSFVGAGLAAVYPFTKRYTQLPQVVLGLAFGWAVPMGFAAETGEVSPVAWLLLLATVLWALVYDTMYAMVDREDDVKIGVKSTAILFGSADRPILGMLQLSMLAVLFSAGHALGLGWGYWFSLLGAASFAICHQYLIKDRDPERCFLAFKNNNWLGACVFAGLLVEYL